MEKLLCKHGRTYQGACLDCGARFEDLFAALPDDRQREGMRTLGHALADYRESKMR